MKKTEKNIKTESWSSNDIASFLFINEYREILLNLSKEGFKSFFNEI